ncbi:MAG: class I SAM-dependent methyltransferase [Gemmatimonadales bacterium]|nr:class I SAM-dependent methyltransferase [Gemmatimonadales bacterium]
MDRKEHWEAVYRSKRPTEVSWYQVEADLSARLIQDVVPDRAATIIDVGGGASVLISQLDAAGYTDLTVLDLSGAAIAAARAALGPRADRIQWLEDDILEADLVPNGYHFWHDRAVFHFLTDPGARSAYVEQVRRAVPSGGFVLVATFAEDGPSRCSGLDVMRYSPTSLHAEFGHGFVYVAAHREEHRTPSGGLQAFTYCLCRREAVPGPPPHHHAFSMAAR